MKIYLSSGHDIKNDKGSGAHSEWGDEALLAAEVKYAVAAQISVMVDNDTMPLGTVVKDVNNRVGRYGLAVELHFNSVSNRTAHGTLCVVANSASAEAKKHAAAISRVVAEALGTEDKGVRTERESGRDRLAFVRDTLCPAVIVEICFLSNEEDMLKFHNRREELVNGLVNYFKGL